MSNHQHNPSNEGLTNSVASTPSSSVHPLELPPQHEIMSASHLQDSNIHMQANSMVGDVSMDATEDHTKDQGHTASTPTSTSGNQNPSTKETPAKSEGGAKTKDKRERLSKPVSRACVACHTGKTRCSNTLPCESCVKRGIANTCAYPDPLDHSTESNVNHPIAPRRRGAHAAAAAAAQAQAQAQQQQQQQQQVQHHGSPAGGSSLQGSPHPNQLGAQQSQQSVFSAGPTVRGFYYDNGSGSGPGTFAAPSAPVPPGPGGSNGSMISPGAPSSIGVGLRRDQSPSGQGNARPLKKARYRNLTEAEMSSFQPKPYKRGTFYVGESAPVTIDPRLPLRLLLADEERVDFFVGDGLPP